MSDYSYLTGLTNSEIEALRIQTTASAATLLADAVATQATADQEEIEYQAALAAKYQPPIVSGEYAVHAGGDGPAVIAHIGVDITIAFGTYTGNGDDGFGVIKSWDVPLELRTNFNTIVHVSGEKVSGEATLLEADGTGSLPEFENSLLVSDEGVIIPDMFDPDVERNPDDVFVVTTGAPAADQIYGVTVFAPPADATFAITVGPETPDQIFDVQSIHSMEVFAAEPPFMVVVFAEPADQIFEVTTSATPADQVFTVTRGPDTPDQIFNAYPATAFSVSTGWAMPDLTFSVTTGPAPAATPDQTFDVSVGGPDAPPIPAPDLTFSVTTGPAIPDKTYSTTVVESLEVITQEPPFIVTVGAEVPDQIFNVTTSAKPFDESFAVTVGPEIPDETFTVAVVNVLAIEVYDSPKQYSVQENNTPAYVLTGEGLTYAVNPAISLTIGQTLRLSLDLSSNTMWIKDVQEGGPGVSDPAWATIINQGSTTNTIRARFWTAGTYYYQSAENAGVFGEITVS